MQPRVPCPPHCCLHHQTPHTYTLRNLHTTSETARWSHTSNTRPHTKQHNKVYTQTILTQKQYSETHTSADNKQHTSAHSRTKPVHSMKRPTPSSGASPRTAETTAHSNTRTRPDRHKQQHRIYAQQDLHTSSSTRSGQITTTLMCTQNYIESTHCSSK